MGTIGFVAVVVFLFIVAAAVIVVRRARDFRRLVDDGVEATGVVEEKLAFGRVASARKGKHIRYAYRDAEGREHRFRSQVTEGRYAEFSVGDPIAVVYSRSNPAVSAPKWLVDEAKSALAKGGKR